MNGGKRKCLLDLPITVLHRSPALRGVSTLRTNRHRSGRTPRRRGPPCRLTTRGWPTACIVQWDNDASEEILTASFDGVHLFDFDSAAQKFSKRQLGKGHAGKRPDQGSSEVALGALASQKMRFIATIEPWHGNEVVVYEVGTPTTMGEERVVIDSALKDGHALACFDIEKDGNDEIVAGERGGDKALRIYQFAAGSAEWEMALLDEGNMGAAGLFIADINKDGYQDIVAIGTATQCRLVRKRPTRVGLRFFLLADVPHLNVNARAE